MLKVSNLHVEYWTDRGNLRAVEDVSLTVAPGEIVGLAGESGSGKSTLIQAIMRILPSPGVITGGEVQLGEVNVLEASAAELRSVRWVRLSLVFQSAMNALNPVATVREQIMDTLEAHPIPVSNLRSLDASELMRLVGLQEECLDKYPHELSGGMRQRVVIALALALRPQLVILDEPTTALDVVVQREILQELLALRTTLGFGSLFITHDLPLMQQFCDRIGILYGGKLVEMGEASALGGPDSHPYTRSLVGAFRSEHGEHGEVRAGKRFSLHNRPAGCVYQSRCPQASERCLEPPPWHSRGEDKERGVACWNWEETP